MVNALQLNVLMRRFLQLGECSYVGPVATHIPVLMKDNIAATKNKMNTTARSFALLKLVLVDATSHQCCAQN